MVSRASADRLLRSGVSVVATWTPAVIGWRAVRNFVDQEGVQWSGALAFYLVLSVPPLLIAAFSVSVAVVGEETAREYVAAQVTQFLPAQRDVVRQIATQTISASGPAIPAAFAFLLFSGSRVFASLIAAINVMWREVPEPGFIRRQIVRIVMLLTTGVLFAVAGAADVAVALAGDAIPGSISIVVRLHILPGLLMAAALLLIFKLVPRRAATWKSAIVGGVVGAVLLRAAQAAFTAYLGVTGGFESAYGPIAGAAAVMTWALVASAAILLSAHLVAILNQENPDDGDARREIRAPGADAAVRGARDG